MADAIVRRLPRMSREELLRRIGDPGLTIMDALPAASYEAGHIRGAVSLPLADVPARAAQVLPDRDAEIVTYCASNTCPAGEEAGGLLVGMGYRRVSHYHGGMQEWTETGGPVEAGRAPIVITRTTDRRSGPPRADQKRAGAAVRPARFQAGMDALAQLTIPRLLALWLAMIVIFGLVYWIAGESMGQGLSMAGQRIDPGMRGLADAFYFSCVTALSIGYGDIVPLGLVRTLAIAEGGAGLLIFGVVISKLVSRRQDQLIEETHRIAFEDRLGRVRNNLHLVLSELQAIQNLCASGSARPERVISRIESTSAIFAGELRAIHDLLYRPQTQPDEEALQTILISLAANLSEMGELLACLPEGTAATPGIRASLLTLRALANEICGECVPREYAPQLAVWMNRIQQLAARLQ